LYELVAGRPPLGPSADTLDTLRRIREEVPPLASAAARSSGVRLDAPKPLRDDLDRVLAKALEKSPARRYATAAEFADDLGALRLGGPVGARPAARAYRASRFARRHGTLVGASAAVAVALGVGIAGLAAGFLEAERQRRIAIDERDAQHEINR